MRTIFLAAMGLAALALAGCDKAENSADADTDAPAVEQPAGSSTERAREALGQAGETARQTMENLGEAGKAGIEAVQENAPAIREGLDKAGERVRDAADALTRDRDVPGDSEADADEVPEAAEPPR